MFLSKTMQAKASVVSFLLEKQKTLDPRRMISRKNQVL